MSDLKKSRMHSKILGDFGEAFVMYWLSKRDYEPILVDYAGIDVIAYSKSSKERLGISVKSRTRRTGTEKDNLNVNAKQIPLIREACKYFDCLPYFGCVIDKDNDNKILIILVPLEDILQINKFKEKDKTLYIRFTDDHVKQYRDTKNSYIIFFDYSELRNSL